MPGEIVRQSFELRGSEGRHIVERLALRVPALGHALGRLVFMLRPRSVLRQAAVRGFVRLAMEATNRRDYEAAFALLPDDSESITPPELVNLGFDPTYRGRHGRARFMRQWITELGEFHHEPEEIIDLGDRILVLARMTGRGASGGPGFESEVAYLVTISGGRLASDESFRDQKEAMGAAGIASDSGRPRVAG